MIVDRRSFVTLLTAAASSLLYGCKSSGAAGKLGIPGLFPGRVVSVHHSGSHTGGEFQLEPIRSMMRRGMVDLTGAPDWIAAWRLFFERGDVVGIKVNPVGSPDVISCAEVLREIIAGLNESTIATGGNSCGPAFRIGCLMAYGKIGPWRITTGSSWVWKATIRNIIWKWPSHSPARMRTTRTCGVLMWPSSLPGASTS